MAKAEKKQDMRDGMWSQPPAMSIDNSVYDKETARSRQNPDIASPGLKPQAEGQTTHE